MGVFSQAALLLWKNIILRFRFPSILLFEVIWPILIVGVVAVMRTSVPPYKTDDCHYQPRAMPSAGAVPFLQNFVCNLGNKCYMSDGALNFAKVNSDRFSKLSQDLAPYFGSAKMLDLLGVSPKSSTLINAIEIVVHDKDLMDGLQQLLNISSYFREPEKVKAILVNDYKFSKTVVDALMDSKLNVAKLLNLTGAPDLRSIVCDPNKLLSYLKFPVGADVVNISETLCGINDSEISNLTNQVVRQLNITAFIDALELFEKVKDRLGSSNTLTLVYNSIAEMIEVIMSEESVVKFLGDFAAIPDIANIIRRIPDWIKEFSGFSSALNIITDVVLSLEPLIIKLKVENSTAWVIVNDGIKISINIRKLAENEWNGTAEEFVQPIRDLLKNSILLSQEKGAQEVIAVIEFLTQIDWLDVYNNIRATRTLNEETILQILEALQEMLEKLPNWSVVQKIAKVAEHGMDMVSVFTEKSKELKHALRNLTDTNVALKKELNRLFQYGPVVTRVLLEAFTSTNVFNDIIKYASTYLQVCHRVVTEIQTKVPDDVYKDIYRTLCAGDIVDGFDVIIDRMKLSEIRDLINATVSTIELLYDGDFNAKAVPLTDLYNHYSRLKAAISSYTNDDYSWTDMFLNITMDSLDFNEVGWESIKELLNMEFLKNGLLDLYRGLGQALHGLPVSAELAPYVHMLSRLSKMAYDIIHDFTVLFSSNSVFIKTIRLSTNYMSDIVKGISYMWHQDMDSLFLLASSLDPLNIFCTDNYIQKMNMSAHVPMTELNNLICNTDWTIAINDIKKVAKDIEDTVVQIIELFNTDSKAAYDIEGDWDDMMNYTEGIIYTLNSDHIANLSFVQGYITFVNSMNLTEMEVGFDILLQTLQSIMTTDMNRFANLSTKILENLDQTLASDSSWHDFKWYLAWFDAYLDILIDSTELLQNRSIQAVLDMYPSEVKSVTTLLASAYPQFVAALKNIILDPMKLTNYLLQEGFKSPDCENHYIADYILLPRSSAVHSLEKYICSLNTSTLTKSFTNGPPVMKVYSQKVTELLQNGNYTIDWSKLIMKINSFIGQMSAIQLKEGFDLYPFNISAIDMSWQEFYRAAETLGNMDLDKILNLAFKIQDLTIKLIGETAESDISTAMFTNTYVSYHFIKMLATEMAFFNANVPTCHTVSWTELLCPALNHLTVLADCIGASAKVVLFDYLSSNELEKLTALITSSPEINAVCVATLQRLLSSPSEALVFTSVDGLCSNLSLFSKVFLVEVSSLAPAVLQKTVCDLNINFTLLLEQVTNSRPSIREFIDAMKLLSTDFDIEDIRVNSSALISEYKLFSDLLQSLVSHPPIILLSEDEKWMNLTLYSQQWEALWHKLTALGEDLTNSSILMDWQSAIAETLLMSIEKVPGTEKALAYIDVILDYVQNMLDHTISNNEDLKQYPNVNSVVNLLNSAPETIQSLLYTVLTQPEKTLRWNEAFQSWTTLCNTPLSTIISVPPEVDFSMEDFLDAACHIDIDGLYNELVKYQGGTVLETMIQNQTATNVNSSTIHQKFDRALKSITELVTDPFSQEINVLAHLMNVSVWEEVGDNIDIWLDGRQFNFSSLEKITQSVSDIIEIVFDTLPPDVMKMYSQVIAVADVVLDQMMFMLDRSMLHDAFKDLPTWQMLAALLDELPELFEAVVYTSFNYPEKISNTVLQVTSWETFCVVADSMLVLPSNSTFNYKNWMKNVCSVNITNLVDEIGNYSLTKKINAILNSTYTGDMTLKSLVNKAERIINKMNEGIDVSEHVFDRLVWNRVIDRVSSWARIWTSASADKIVVNWGSVVAKTLLTTLEKIPGTGQALAYIDAVLDMFLTQVDLLNGGIDGLYNYTNANIVLRLLESAPEAVQTLLYTVMTEPSKTARWSEAFQSMDNFCNTPTSNIMTVPSELNFNMANFVAGVCKLNIKALAQELAQYQGSDRLERVLIEGTGGGYNISVMIEKVHQVLKSVTDSITNPADMSRTPFFRLFNGSLWEEVRGRIEVWADKNREIFSSPEQISEIVGAILDVMFVNLTEEVRETYYKTAAIADIILSQVLVIISSNSLNESVHDLPSLQVIVGLLNELPELYETVLYSSMFSPEKITAKISLLTSMEAFCMNNPQDMFTIAPNSSFDLTSWLSRLCSINTTGLIYELQDYAIAKEIDRVINGRIFGYVNMSFIIDKAEQIVTKLNGGFNINDRIFDTKIWTSALDRVNNWIWPYKSFDEIVVNWGSVVAKTLLTTLEKIPGTGQALAYIDAVLDMFLTQVDLLNGGIDGLYNYTNANIVLRLLESAPEAVQTLLYTVMTEPSKTSRWNEAFQSMDNFCNTPTSNIMTVPSELNFNMANFVAGVCKLNIKALAQELAQYQGSDRLERVLIEGTGGGYNISVMIEKVHQVLKSVTDSITNPADMSRTPFFRLFNGSLWEEVRGRIEVWADKNREIFSSPEQISEIVGAILDVMFVNLTEEVRETYYKTAAIADIILSQVLVIISSNSLNESVHDLPSLQVIVGLLNELPELYETVLYSSMFSPEKITAKISLLTSMEAFCMNNPQDMFTIAPNSSFDLTSWLSRLCSINTTGLIYELQDYAIAKEIDRVINGRIFGYVNMSSIIDKAEQIVTKLNGGFNINDRIFDTKIWTSALDRVNNWIWPYKSFDEIVVNWGSVVAKTLLTTLEKIPGTGQALAYIDAVLDMFLTQVDLLNGGIDGLYNYTNANIVLRLLESAPEAVQTLLYTVMTEPSKTSRWNEAFQSMDNFCNTPTSNIMTVPSELNFNMANFVAGVCKLNIKALAQELAQYQGSDRLERVLIEGTGGGYNISVMIEKVHQVLKSVTDSITNPADMSRTPFFRLFNGSLWEEVRGRIEVWADKNREIFSSPEQISEIVGAILDVMFVNLTEEVRETYYKTAAIADIILSQVLVIISSNSLNESVHDLPSLQVIVGLLNELPELYETVLYSSMFSPEKITAKISLLTSMEAFCMNNPQDMFTIAPNSSFDLTSWLSRLCSINTTGLIYELQDYAIAKEIDRVINGRIFGYVNMSSIIDKAEQIVTKLNGGFNINDRIFDTKIWTSALDRVNNWIWPYKSFDEIVVNWGSVVAKTLLTTLEKIPGTGQALAYIDAVLDMFLTQVDLLNGGIDGLYNNTNANIVLRLLESAPEAVQTLLYTVMTEPSKTARWSEAFQSMDNFCNTPTSNIMTVPSELNFNMANFVAGVCKLNIKALAQELAQYQGSDRLERVLIEGTGGGYNISVMIEKVHQVLKSVTDSITNPADMSRTPFFRLFNGSLWEEVRGRIEVWADKNREIFSSPEQISEIVGAILDVMFVNLTEEVRETYYKTAAIADIILSQVLVIISSNSLNESVHDLPSLQVIVGLLNELPELYETVLYSSMFFPEKIIATISLLTSMEAFCMNIPQDTFTIAPNSSFDLMSWLSQLCSINTTSLIYDLQDYAIAKDIDRVMNGSTFDHVNMSSIIDKAEQIVTKLNGGFNINDRIFDKKIWSSALDRVNNWIWQYKSFNEIVVNWGSVVAKTLLTTLEKIPGTGQALAYIDAVLDMFLAQVDLLNGGIDGLYNYTNANIVLRLLESSPEAVQTLLYTVMTEPSKIARWSEAFQSMDTFCNTPVSNIMSIPSELNFNMSNFVAGACKLNIEALAEELAQYQGSDRLERLIIDGTGSGYNISVMIEKVHQVLKSVTDSITNPADMTRTSFSRLFNGSLWEEVRGRIEVWADKNREIFSSPEKISEILGAILDVMFVNLTEEVRETYHTSAAIADIILSQVLAIISSNSLNEFVHDLPSLQVIVGLLNELPELYEIVLYSSMFSPEKISAKISRLTSMEAFCLNNPQDMFTIAPNSSFDLTSWLSRLCSINTTGLIYELQDYAIAKDIEHMIIGPTFNHSNMSSIIDKAEQIVTKLNGGFNFNDRIFDTKIWTSALDRVNNWIWPYKSFNEFLKDEQKQLLTTFISYIENTPGTKDMIYYVDAVLDLIGSRLDEGHGTANLQGEFNEFPTLRDIIELVKHTPEIIDAALYTLLAHPEKVIEWPEAVQSFTAFCSKSITKIMAVAPDSHFNMEAFKTKLCSVSIDKLVSELTSYQGFNRLHNIASRNENSTINMTALWLKAEYILTSLEYYYNSPLSIVTLDLQLFNKTVWERIGDRVQAWSNITISKYLNAHTIAQIFELVFGPFGSLSPELMDVYNKALAITSVLMDEILMVVEASSLQEAVKGVPDLQLLLKLSDKIPDLLETLIYTSVFHLEKVTLRVKFLVSLEAFCDADMNEILSIPPNSTFDLQSWVSMLCSLNFTEIESQLADFKIIQDIESIVNGSSNLNKNLTSLVDKIESLINQVEQGVHRSDQILNGSIWTNLMDRMDKWIQNYSIYDTALRSANFAGLVLSKIINGGMLQNMAKSLNTINLFMNVTIVKLQAISEGVVSLTSLFTNADGIVRLIDAYIRMGQNLPQAWINGEFNSDQELVQLFGNVSKLHILCGQTSELAKELSNHSQPSETVKDMSTLICSVIDDSVMREVKGFVDYEDIQEKLTIIWSSSYASADFAVFVNNVEMFTNLVRELANKSLTVNSSLTDNFDFTSPLDALRQAATNPKLIFRLLKFLGLVIEGPLHNEQEVVKVLSGINTFAIVPMVNLLDALKTRGLTLMTITSNPEILLDALSTLVDFDAQFSIIETVAIKPQLQQLITNHKTVCNNTGNENYLITQGVEQLSLPVPWQQLWTLICETSDTDEILKKMKEAGLTAVQIMVLVDKISPVGQVSDIPEMFNHDFGWIDLMSSLEKLADLTTQSIVNQSGLHTLRNAWNSVKDIVFDKSLGSILSYLNLMDGLEEHSENWVTFKQTLRFFSSILHFLDKNLQKFGHGKEVQIQDILPDSNKVAILIQNVFGTTVAAEILTSSIDPIMFYRITLSESWDEICTGNNSLSNYFHLPEEVDVLAVQESLCKAVKSRSSSFQELLSLFDAGDMLKQLDMLFLAELNNSVDNSTVWESMHSTVLHFIQTAENMQKTQINMSSIDSWFTVIVNTLYYLQYSDSFMLNSMCDSMISYLNNTEEFTHNRGTAFKVITAFILISDWSNLLPELDELTCIFVSSTGFDLGGTMKKLQSIGFWDIISKAVKQSITPPEPLSCSAILHGNALLMKMINFTVLNNGLNINQMSQCLSRAEDNFEATMISFTKTINFIKEMFTILQIPELQKLLQDPNLVSIVNIFIEGVSSGNEGFIHLADLLQDKVRAAEYLMNTLGWSQSVVNSFLNTSVNTDLAYFLTQPTEEVKDILCNPDKLSHILSIPIASLVNVTEISSMICTTEIIHTVNFLKNISAMSETIKDMMPKPAVDIVNFINIMATDLAAIIVQFNDLFIFMTEFMTDFNINVLRNHFDILDEIAQGHILTNLTNSLDSLVDNIAEVLPANNKRALLIKDIRKVLKGILSLDIFKDFILEQVQVKNMVKDPKYLAWYLTSELHFNSSIVQDVMDAVFSSQMFMGLIDRPSYTCEDVLSMIIIMNSTQATVKNVSDAICALDEVHLRDLVQALTPELNIGSLVAKYVTNTGNAILKATNLTAAELDDISKKMYFGLADLKEASDIIKKSPNGEEIINIFGNGQADSLISLDKLTPVLCGIKDENIFDLDFSPGVAISTNTDIQEEFQNGVQENELDLPNEFCVSMYENIKKSGIGSILWSYLKPIISGKILYTPDNEVTRNIMSKANKLFDDIYEVNRVAKIWAEEAPNLMLLADAARNASELRDALGNDFVKGLLESTSEIKVETLISGLDAFQADNFDKNQLSTLQKAAEIVANYSSCIVTSRFQPVESESKLEQEAYKLSQSKTFLAGIVFLNVGTNQNSSTAYSGGRKRRQAVPNIPTHVGYKIRMDVDNVMDTLRLKSALWKMSSEDNFVEDLRYLRGFIYLQDMIDTAIIETNKDQMLTTPGIKIRQMPFPCHHDDNFIFMLGAYLIPVMMTFTFLASLGVATYNLMQDRENGQDENLHIMGMIRGLNFISWMMSTMIIMTVVSLILAIMLKYTNIFIYSNFFIIFLYLVDFCFSSVMLLYMVSAFFTNTTMAILFVLMIYLISYMPYILVIGLDVSMTFWQKTVACIASTTAFSFGALRLAYLEQGAVGIQWSNVTEASSGDVSFSWICIMMLIDSAGYFLIGWYVRNVKPGKYGISQPWYFPIKPSFWSSCFRSKSLVDFDSVLTSDTAGNLFEPTPEGLTAGIAIKNLSKTYSNKKQAVKLLTVSFYENHITSLLGHNGAAKTTTMKMICGVLEPTSGQIRINGMEPKCYKHSLGVCPQQNSLFYYMTVREHMKFYAGIKGANNTTETHTEIKKLLRDVDLWYVRNTPVQNLSYGMKRRLCVALAFVGGSKTIILDEPTSGVDPHARRNIWNLITTNKSGRTILLSTHHLDEADMLSDRIAIMHQGKLLCCGSPAFLKRAIGDGYSLTVVKKQSDPECQQHNENAEQELLNGTRDTSTAILSYIQSECPKAAIVEQVGTDITFKIPKDPTEMKIPFHQFFRQLDEFSDQIGISSYGLSDTTIEEVFLKITQEADRSNDLGAMNPKKTSYDRAAEVDLNDTEESMPSFQDKMLFSPATRIHYCPQPGSCTVESVSADEQPETHQINQKRRGAALVFSQIGALLLKRCHHYRRNWRILLTAVILPLIGLLISVGFSSVKIKEEDTKPLVLDPSIYGPQTNMFYQDAVNNMMSLKFVSTLTDAPVGIGTPCMEDWAAEYFEDRSCGAGSSWYNITRPFYIVGCRDFTQMYSEMPSTFSVSEKVVPSDEVLQDLGKQKIPSYLLSTFKDYKENRFGGWSFEKNLYGTIFDVDPYVWFNSKGYHALPSFFNSLSNVILRSQLPNGKMASKYGITTINHPLRLGKEALSVKNLQGDAADAGVSLVIVIAFSFIPSGFILYLINERINKERQLQNISGIHYFTYWFVAFTWDLFVYAITVGLAVIIVVIFKTESFYLRDNLAAFASITLLYGWAIIPCLYCVNRAFSKGSTAYLVTFCVNLFLALATVISLLVLLLFRDSYPAFKAYEVLRYLFLIFPQYALGQGLLNMASNTMKYKIFLRFEEDKYDSPFSSEIIGWHLVALGCEGVFFFILTLLLDGFHAPSIGFSHKKSSRKFTDIDEDVLREQERIHQTPNTDLLVVKDLSKNFQRGLKKFEAVSHISFGIPEGECFGLLGVNGAGKTTTFRMLTGDCKPSAGTTLLKGHKISPNSKHFGQDFGYCSQEGGLDDYLTGEETLYFHSRLRGFRAKQTKTIVNELLTRLALTQYAQKPVHTYSGGTKRKLALAVALLGDPPILYLDEPTTGMDAATRRLAWKCIEQANTNGQSIVLTSHSMDECDSLCSRIAIMVNGQIKCIGSPQYLKHKFGDGYTVVVHSSHCQLNEIIETFLQKFPATIVKAKHYSGVELRIPQTAGSVADILILLQSLQENSIIDYYTLSQTTLDSVFISFAEEQSDHFDDESSSRGSTTCSKSISSSESVSPSTALSSSLMIASERHSTKYGFTNPQFAADEMMITSIIDQRDGNYDQNIKVDPDYDLAISEDNFITKL